MNVAENILRQLGGHRFTIITGARDFVSDGNKLHFKLPKPGKDKINFVTIELQSNDLYNVIFQTYRNLEIKEVSKLDCVYGDQLKDIFFEKTGLRTYL